MHDIVAMTFTGAALLLLACGMYAWQTNATAAANRTLLLLCILLAISNVAKAFGCFAHTADAARVWYQIAWIGWAFYPPVACQVALMVSDQAHQLRRRTIQVVLYLPAFLLLIRAWTARFSVGLDGFTRSTLGHFVPHPAPSEAWNAAYQIYQYGIVLLVLGVLAWWGRTTISRRKRKQSEVLVFAIGVAIGLDILRQFLPFDQREILWALEYLVFAAGLTFSITRHHFIVPTTTLAANYIVGHVRDMIILTDTAGIILQVNAATVELLGWEEHALIGQSLLEFFTVAEARTEWPLPGCSLASSARLEAAFINRNGDILPIDLTCAYLYDAYHDVSGIIVLGTDLRNVKQLECEVAVRAAAEDELRQARDTLEEQVQQRTLELAEANADLIAEIAERERIDQALRESESRYRSLFEHMSEGVALCTVIRNDAGQVIDWRPDDVNPGLERILGLSWQDNRGGTALGVIGPERTERYLPVLNRLMATGVPMQIDSFSPELGRHLLLSFFQLSPDRFAMLMIDTTDRRRSEAALRESEARYRGLFEHMREGVTLAALITDARGAIADWMVYDVNPSMERIMALSRDDMVTHTATEILGAARRDRYLPLLTRMMATNEPVQVDIYSPEMAKHLSLSFFPLGPGRFAMVAMDITARKHAEATLRAREEELRVLLNAPIGLAALLDLDGIILAINEPGAQRLGGDAETLLGQSIFALLPPEVAATRRRYFDDVCRTGKVTEFTDHHAGRTLWSSVYPVFDGDGHVVRIAIFAQDITDRDRAEKALRESEENYRALTETSTDIIMRFDREFRHTFVNQAVTQVGTMPPEAFLGKTHRELGYPEDMCVLCEEMIGRVFASGQPADIELTFANPQGRHVLDWRLFPEFAEDGRVRSVITSARDISRMKAAEEALRTSEEHFRTIVETFPGMIWMSQLDENYTPIFLSEHVEGIYGYPKEEFLSGRLSFTDIVFPEDLARLDQAVSEALRERRTYAIELRFRRADGQTLWVQEVGAGVYGDDGTLRYLIGSVLDITERKRTETALQERDWQYRALFANMNEGFALAEIEYNAHGQPIDLVLSEANPLFEEMFDLPPTGVVGARGSVIFGVDLLRPYLDVCAHVAETGASDRVEVEDPDTDRAFIVSLFSPSVGRIAAIFYDVTARTQAERQIAAYQRELLALAAELSTAEERERRRIATELHDTIIQNLALTKIMLASLRAQIPAGDAATALDDVRKVLDDSIQSARTLTFELSPPVLYELGLHAAVEWLAERMQQRYGLHILLHDNLLPVVPDIDRRALLFTAIREMLINVVKHAHATQAVVTLHRDAAVLAIIVEDNGVGLDPQRLETPGDGGGFGLFSIRERLRHIGGSLEVSTGTLGGARVTLRAPIAVATATGSV
jgi:PAS domain S-box-containing protein